jgi:ketosteroid isomerase-like protein
MIDHDFAQRFATEWIAAWNMRDIDAVLDHYDEDIAFTSPFIIRIAGEPSGTLKGKAALRPYFEKALAAVPDLRFELIDVYKGVDSVVLNYRSYRGGGSVLAAEVLVFGSDGKVIRGFANYENLA